MPASVCLLTISATAERMRTSSAVRSTGTPSSLANIARIRSSGRGRLPVWVVRKRLTPYAISSSHTAVRTLEIKALRLRFCQACISATTGTIGTIGRRELALTKPTGFLINVSRAEIVDEAALYDALSERSIAGAALDVWYRYPRDAGPIDP